MKKIIFTFSLAVVVACASCSNNKSSQDGQTDTEAVVEEEVLVNPADTFTYTGYKMLTDILGGKTPADAQFMSQVTSSPAFNVHSNAITSSWNTFTQKSLDKIRKWSADNLGAKVDTVFYPFGGPDFNYLASFFPDVKYSVMIGMEKPGSLPFTTDADRARVASVLNTLRAAVSTNMSSSFFQTINMKSDLDSDLQGTLPVVLMMMSLHGFDVLTVNPIKVNENGEIVYTDPDNVWAHSMDKKFDQGYEVIYRQPGEKDVRKINYLSVDLSNEGFKSTNLDKMVNRYFKDKTTFLKAASYLMDRPTFTDVRDAILDNAQVVITGPSGIPYKNFDKDKWDITLYGNYTHPIALFSTRKQEDLRAAYQAGPKQPIDFRFDYGEAAFFKATKK